MSSADAPPVSRGLLTVLGLVVGLAVVAALWVFVAAPLLGDEPVAEAESRLALADAPVGAVPQVTPTPEPTPLPETAEVLAARDPFQQLVGPTAAAPPPTPAPVDPTDPPDPDAPDPVDPVDPDAPDDPAPDDPAPGVQVGDTRVRLVDVGVTRVTVEVNGDRHEAAEGETFAERFRVLDINGDCATFLFGDNRFTLCEGEEVRK